jgi:hypothetical protein
LVLPGFLLRSP